MGAIMNGLALHGGVRPVGSTFLIFSDYMRPPIRLAALCRLPVIYVFTHDSIGLGEDGPTHQPIEQLAALRAIPDLAVIRPADPTEVVEAWRATIRHAGGPVALVFTRQKVAVIDRARYAPSNGLRLGGYVLADAPGGAPAVILMASGSEVELVLGAHQQLAAAGIAARVVSMPCMEFFASQPREYREAVLPPSVPARLAVEAAAAQPWYRWVGDHGAVLGVERRQAVQPLAYAGHPPGVAGLVARQRPGPVKGAPPQGGARHAEDAAQLSVGHRRRIAVDRTQERAHQGESLRRPRRILAPTVGARPHRAVRVRRSDEPRALARSGDLFAPVRERHGDARRVRHVVQLPRLEDPSRGDEACGRPGRHREDDRLRLDVRAARHGEPPAARRRSDPGDALRGPDDRTQARDQGLGQLGHTAREAPESAYVRGYLDAEQLCGAAFGERLEPPAGPERGAPGQLVHQPVPEPELAGEGLNVALAHEEAVGPALHEEAVTPLGQHDAASASLALEHDHVRSRPRQLPRGRQTGESGADDDARQTHARSAAVRRARSASAATSRALSFNESVRSSRTPSRSASPRYAMSTSYNTST